MSGRGRRHLMPRPLIQEGYRFNGQDELRLPKPSCPNRLFSQVVGLPNIRDLTVGRGGRILLLPLLERPLEHGLNARGEGRF